MRALCLGLLFLLAGCGRCGGDEPRDAGATPPAPPPTFRIALLTDTKGYLEPCGCTSRPLGGLGRLGTTLEGLREGTPTLFLAVGDLFFGGPVTDEGAAAEERWQAETLVDVWGDLGLVAATPGKKDLARASELPALRARARFPWLAAGATPLLGEDAGVAAAGSIDAGTSDGVPRPTTALSSVRMIERGGRRIGIVGASDAFPLEVVLPAARAAVAQAKQSGATFVVVLARGDRTFARSLAEIRGVNLVAHGGLDQEIPSPPTVVRGALVVQGGRQGQRLVSIDVYARGDGAFEDASAWSQEAARAELELAIRERRADIARWEREGGVSAADLTEQRRRVDAMQREIEALERPRDLSQGNLLVARVLELDPDIASDSAITQRLRVHDRRVNEHNRVALADRVPIPVPEGAAAYVGSAQCRSCHAPAYAWWQGHHHGRAYQTLVDRDKQFSLACVGCHVTGYDRPGGATVTHNMDGALVNVGCESCHGPGSAHVASPTTAHLVEDVPESTCIGCHNPEHSDRFQYAGFRASLRVPGHGLPVTP